MPKIPMFQVDAFTSVLFGGNPAAVCLLDEWPEESLMQSIAAENNLAETAFVVKKGESFGIRWFTPAVEVDLCGHATLASGYVIFNHTDFRGDEILLWSPRSGELKVRREGTRLYLDFPADQIAESPVHEAIIKGIGTKPEAVFKGKTDYMAVLGSEAAVRSVKPDFREIEKLEARGLIITAPGDNVDFVSRFFGPQCGVPEDPVTGSAHTTLTPYWAGRLGKTTLTAMQVSKRTGWLECRNAPPRVIIGGEARLYMTAEVFL